MEEEKSENEKDDSDDDGQNKNNDDSSDDYDENENPIDEDDLDMQKPVEEIKDLTIEDKHIVFYMDSLDLSGKDVEKTKIDKWTLKQLKVSLQLRFKCLMTTIAKILLSRKEEMLACLLVSFYKLSVDEKLIL